jgi:hypothetical protein
MATGDRADITARLKALLPRWFGTGATPVLDGLLQGPASALAFIYNLFAYAKLQTRIKSATDGFLDLISGDFFGVRLLRRAGQGDNSYRAVILATLLRLKVSRQGMINALTTLTGRAPIIIEGDRPADTGAYDAVNAYWDSPLGVWGERLPYQCAVIVYRPLPGTDQYGVTDEDIRLTIEAVKPAGTIVWFQIQN